MQNIELQGRTTLRRLEAANWLMSKQILEKPSIRVGSALNWIRTRSNGCLLFIQ